MQSSVYVPSIPTLTKQRPFQQQYKGKVKVNVDLYSASSWTHL